MELKSDDTRPVQKDYSEYWGAQVSLVRILQKCGVNVDVRDRLPIFRLWLIINQRMTGPKKENILQLLQSLRNMRLKGLEPEHDGKKY